MLITSKIDSSSNGYSIVNKNYIEGFSRDFVRCAVANITNPSSGSSYSIAHNLGTQNVVVDVYAIGNSNPTSVTASYSVTDSSTIVVSFDSLGSGNPNIRVVVMGAVTYSTATATLIQNN